MPKREAKGRVLLMFLLILAFMFVEITSGYIFGSVTLLMDGAHMGIHALAFGISVTAYMLARRWSMDVNSPFGTWKVKVLGAYTSRVLLSMMVFLALIEALLKFINKVAVKYEEALLIAFGKLLVSLISAFVLSHEEDHKHGFNLKSVYLHVLTDALTLPMQSFQSLLDAYCGTDGINPEDGKGFKILSIVQQVLKLVLLSSCKRV